MHEKRFIRNVAVCLVERFAGSGELDLPRWRYDRERRRQDRAGAQLYRPACAFVRPIPMLTNEPRRPLPLPTPDALTLAAAVESSDVNIDPVFEHDYSVREVDDFEIADAPIHLNLRGSTHGGGWISPHPSQFWVSPVDMPPEWVGRFEIAVRGSAGDQRRLCGNAAPRSGLRRCWRSAGIVIDARNPEQRRNSCACFFRPKSVAQSPDDKPIWSSPISSLVLRLPGCEWQGLGIAGSVAFDERLGNCPG